MTSRFVSEWLNPFWDLMHLKGNPEFSLELLQDGWRERGLWRSEVILRSHSLNLEESGMAEGSSGPLTRLRAASEAYERICHRSAVEQGRLNRNEELSFGYAVARKSQVAILRARAEYFERMRAQDLCDRLIGDKKMISQAIETPDGRVWISAIEGVSGAYGTGYGFSEKEAIDSAQRSCKRKQDFPNSLHRFPFHFTDVEPQIIRLTPERAWLECYFCGHTRK